MKMVAYKYAYIHIQHRQLQKYKYHNKICGYIVEELHNKLENCNCMCKAKLLQKCNSSSCTKRFSSPLWKKFSFFAYTISWIVARNCVLKIQYLEI